MKEKVAFVCVHNSCRSQIAEVLGKSLVSEIFESYSAGTETKPQINQDAVRLMKEQYQIDMEETQYSKLSGSCTYGLRSRCTFAGHSHGTATLQGCRTPDRTGTHPEWRNVL